MRMMSAGLAALAFFACAGPEAREEVRPLVDAAWLNDNLDEVVVLDVRTDNPAAGPLASYAAGHITGAIHAPYGRTPWRVTRDGVPGMLPPIADMERLIGGLGIANDDDVVIVAAGMSAAEMGTATRVYWEFKVLGHERVSILDGGFAAWRSAGYPVETRPNAPGPTSYAASFQPQLVAGTEDVVDAVEDGRPLIDARSANYYRGAAKSRVAARYGTIAGARNIPHELLTVGNGGTFIDAETARSLWAEAGVPTTGEQIAFCNTGHLASIAWFTAYEVLGNKEARLYDGSLAEWSAYPDLPMGNTDNPDRE